MRAILKSAVLEMDRLRSRFESSDVSIFHEFMPPPYGGANQFLLGLKGELERRGWRLENNRISPSTRACLYNSFNFDFDRLRRFARKGCIMVHRVDGPIGVYRGRDDGTDRKIWTINGELADVTVFQSEYSRQEHLNLGMTFTNAHVVRNSVDPGIFNREGRVAFDPGRRVRLIATSWSDNVRKGTEIYQWLDEHLDWDRFEFTFVGRSPVTFRRIRMVPAVPSEEVAALLRRHDVFITGSEHDPCSNALLEALACGLPAVFLRSGGHPEIVGEGGLPFRDREEIPSVLARLIQEYPARQARIDVPSLAVTTDRYLALMGLPATRNE